MALQRRINIMWDSEAIALHLKEKGTNTYSMKRLEGIWIHLQRYQSVRSILIRWGCLFVCFSSMDKKLGITCRTFFCFHFLCYMMHHINNLVKEPNQHH